MGNEASQNDSKHSNEPSSQYITADDVAPLDIDDADTNFLDDSEYSESFEDNSMYNIEGYTFVQKLGRGASGVVILMEKESKQYAVKVCQITKTHLNFLNPSSHDPKAEAVIMKRLNQPNVVKVFDFIEDVDNNLLYIVMEYMPGGTVETCKTYEEKREVFKEILTGLQYLHNQRLAHRDIKVENVMLTEEKVAKLCDFGISVYVPIGGNLIQTEMKGTPAYCPPEMFTSQQYDPFKADIWAFGVTLYILSFHDLPFKGVDLVSMEKSIENDEPSFPSNADPALVDLIKCMLKKNPDERITIEGIWAHQWSNGLRPLFSGLFMQCANVIHQVSELNTEGVITRVKRGEKAVVKKKKEKKSRRHKLLHDTIENVEKQEKKHHHKHKSDK